LRGVANTIELMILSVAITILIMFAFYYLNQYLTPQTKYNASYLDGKYCGTTLVVKNVGSQSVTIQKIIGVYSNGTAVENIVSIILNPGDTYVTSIGNINNPYVNISIVGNNFAAVNLRNECV